MNKWEKYKHTIFENPNIYYPDPEQLSHATPFKMSKRMVIWVLCLFKKIYKRKLKRVVDLTASIGGDTLNFSQYVDVLSIEINKEKYQCLQKNIILYKRNNVKTLNADSSKWITEEHNIKDTIIYFDPPWGGEDYKHDTIKSLYLGDLEILDVINKCLEMGNLMVVVKLPFNYNLKRFDKMNYSIKKEKKVRFLAFTKY